MSDPDRQPFWKKVKAKFDELAEEQAPAEEVGPPAPQPARPAVRRTIATLTTPGVEPDRLIKGGLRLRRSRYVSCPLPPVNYQTGDLLEPLPPLPPPPPPALADPLALDDASESVRSPHRLAVIEAFEQGRHPLPQMRDPKYLYRIISEEREYQATGLKALRREQALAREEGGDLAALERRIARHVGILQRLEKVLKAIAT